MFSLLFAIRTHEQIGGSQADGTQGNSIVISSQNVRILGDSFVGCRALGSNALAPGKRRNLRG